MDTQTSLARYSENFFLRKTKGYFELMKPRVMSLVIFTAIVGMFLAPGEIPFFEAIIVISAIAIGLWAFLGKHYGILLLQFFYATAGIIGVLRWL